MNSILVLGAGELGTQVLHGLSRVAPKEESLTVLLRPATIDSTGPKRAELDKLKALELNFFAVTYLAALIWSWPLVSASMTRSSVAWVLRQAATFK
jgi:hypothetical protein